jgi:hypothetical protein
MIINISDFTGKYEIHSGLYDQSKLQDYINIYERRYLIELFGASLYNEFISDLDPFNVPQSPNFVTIFNPFEMDSNILLPNQIVISEGIKQMLKGFIYFEYLKDTTNQTTPNGLVIPSNENSTTATTLYSMMYTRYNEAIRTYRAIQWYIVENYNAPFKQVLSIYLLNAGTNYGVGINIPVTGGSGQGLTLNFDVNGFGLITDIYINNPGVNYEPNDIVTITTGDNNATANVFQVAKGDFKKFNGVRKNMVYWI